jgi:uncharacterized paraquat-inducible protein A
MSVPFSQIPGWPLLTIVGVVYWLAIMLWVVPQQLRRAWQRGPADAGADDVFCLNCDYNLRAQTAPRCPECGASYTLGDLLG